MIEPDKEYKITSPCATDEISPRDTAKWNRLCKKTSAFHRFFELKQETSAALVAKYSAMEGLL